MMTDSRHGNYGYACTTHQPTRTNLEIVEDEESSRNSSNQVGRIPAEWLNSKQQSGVCARMLREIPRHFSGSLLRRGSGPHARLVTIARECGRKTLWTER